MFGANLVILAQICDELSSGQAELSRILSQNGQNDLEDHCHWPSFSIPTESIPWCMFGANFVIPAQICDELSCGQGKVYGQTDRRTDRQTDIHTDTKTDRQTNRRTDGQTDRRTQATTITLRLERPRGEKQQEGQFWIGLGFDVICW